MKTIKKISRAVTEMSQNRKHSSYVSRAINFIDSLFDDAVSHLVGGDKINARIWVSTAEHVYRKRSLELELVGAPDQIRDRLTNHYFERLNKIRGELYS